MTTSFPSLKFPVLPLVVAFALAGCGQGPAGTATPAEGAPAESTPATVAGDAPAPSEPLNATTWTLAHDDGPLHDAAFRITLLPGDRCSLVIRAAGPMQANQTSFWLWEDQPSLRTSILFHDGHGAQVAGQAIAAIDPETGTWWTELNATSDTEGTTYMMAARELASNANGPGLHIHTTCPPTRLSASTGSVRQLATLSELTAGASLETPEGAQVSIAGGVSATTLHGTLVRVGVPHVGQADFVAVTGEDEEGRFDWYTPASGSHLFLRDATAGAVSVSLTGGLAQSDPGIVAILDVGPSAVPGAGAEATQP